LSEVNLLIDIKWTPQQQDVKSNNTAQNDEQYDVTFRQRNHGKDLDLHENNFFRLN